jgi:amidohydrolase
MMAGTDVVEIAIQGKGGHAANPHAAVNPIIVASKIIAEIEAIKNYFVNSRDRVVVSICTMNAGKTYNVIPDSGKLTGTVRYFSKDAQDIIINKLKKIVSNIADLYGAKCVLNYKKNYPAVVNDAEAAGHIVDILEHHGLGDHVIRIQEPFMEAEDFSFFLQNVPGAFFFIGTGNTEKDTRHPLHNPAFNLDEDVFASATPAICKILLGFLHR